MFPRPLTPQVCWSTYIILLCKEYTFTNGPDFFTILLYWFNKDQSALSVPMFFASWMNNVLTLKELTVPLSHYLQSSHIFVLRKVGRILSCLPKTAISFTGGALYFQGKPNTYCDFTRRTKYILILWKTQLPLLSWEKCPIFVIHFVERHGWI